MVISLLESYERAFVSILVFVLIGCFFVLAISDKQPTSSEKMEVVELKPQTESTAEFAVKVARSSSLIL